MDLGDDFLDLTTKEKAASEWDYIELKQMNKQKTFFTVQGIIKS